MEKPIIIGGAGSSGTTLLSVLLNRHPEVACGPEMSFFNKEKIYNLPYTEIRENFHKWRKRGLNTGGYWLYPGFYMNCEYYGFTGEKIDYFLKESTNIKEFIEHFADDFLKRSKKLRFAEKTPSNSYCFPEILELFPDARIIHLIRDGRDSYCSFKKKVKHPFLASSGWLYNASAALRMRGHQNYFEERYEILVRNPKETLRRICEHLHIEFDDCMFESTGNEDNERTRKKHAQWNNNPRSGISDTSVGRYRREMDERDKNIFWNTALTLRAKKKLKISHITTKDLMELLGYTFSNEETRYNTSIDMKINVEKIHVLRLIKSLRLKRGWVHRYTKLLDSLKF